MSARSQSAKDIEAILGPPPGSPGFAEYIARQEQQRQATGYVTVPEDRLRRYDYEQAARPLSEIVNLDFTPVDLRGTALAGFELLGGSADHFDGNRASALHRTFRTPSSAVLDLFEWDMSAHGGSVTADPSRQTERVNGLPAGLFIMQAPSGRAVSILSWTEGRRWYQLMIKANVKTTDLSPGLTDIANSIPKSVPARLIETPAGPPGLLEFPPELPPALPGFPPALPPGLPAPGR